MAFGQGGGRGGNAGNPGVPDNIFGVGSADISVVPLGTTPAADRTTAEVTRSNYFGSNPANLASYDANPLVGIYLYFLSGGNAVTVFQTRISSAWVDQVSTVGVQGAPGDDAPSQWFESETARNDFYDANLSLLTTGMIVAVNNDNGTYSVFEWTGGDAPGSQDTNLWVGTGETFPAGSVVLGTDGSTISSGGQVMNYITAGGDQNYMLGVRVETTGTETPFYWDLGAVQDTPVSSVNDTDLASPATITFTVTNNRYTCNYIVIPHQSGDVRVETYIGTDDTGPNLTNFIFTFVGGDIGNSTSIPLPNKYLSTNGTDLFIRFTGAGLRGELATSEPVLSITEQVGFLREYFIQNDPMLNIDSENPTGEARLEFHDSFGALKTSIFYDEQSDFACVDLQGINLDFQSNIADTTALIQFITTGTNGATVPFHFGDRNPEGAVSASQGSVYFRSTGADDTSGIFLKEAGIGNTGWEEFVHTASGVQGPATSVINSLSTWGDTQGDTLNSVGNATLVDDGSTNLLALKSPAVGTGTSLIRLNDSSDNPKLAVAYQEGGNEISFDFGSGSDVTFSGVDSSVFFLGFASDNVFKLDYTVGDTLGFFQLQSSGANGAETKIHVGTRNPNTVVSGDPGDLYFRSSGSSSSVYVHADSITSVNNWINLVSAGAGDVSGPGSSTTSAIATWANNSANLLDDNPLFLFSTSGFNATAVIQSGGVTGVAELELRDSLGAQKGNIGYNETTDTFFMTSAGANGFLSTMGATGTFQITSFFGADTNDVLSLSNTGTNGATAQVFVGDRTPLNNVTALPGSLYVRSDTTSSDLYLHRGAGSNNTGWVDVLATQGDIVGPVSSVVGTFPIWGSVTGDDLDAQSDFSFVTGAFFTDLFLKPPNASSSCSYGFNNSAGALRGTFAYGQISNQLLYTVAAATSGGLRFVNNSAGNIDFNLQNTATVIEFSASNHTSSNTFLRLANSEGSTDIRLGTPSPVGSISAAGGDLYLRVLETDSNLFIKKSSGAPSTANWNGVVSSTSSSSVVNGAVRYTDTTGYNVENVDNIRFVDSGNDTEVELIPIGATGHATINFFEETGTTVQSSIFHQLSDDRLILRNDIDDILYVATADHYFTLLNTTSQFIIDGTTKTDAQNLIRLDTGGTNGAIVDIHVGGRNPEGFVNANPGSLYFRSSGTSSDIYIHRAASAGTTGWADVLASGITSTETTTVINGVVTWADVTGDSVQQADNILALTAADTAAIIVQSPSATGTSEFIIRDSSVFDVFSIVLDEGGDSTTIDDQSANGLDIQGVQNITITPTNNLTLNAGDDIFLTSGLDDSVVINIVASITRSATTAQLDLTLPSATGIGGLVINADTAADTALLTYSETTRATRLAATGTANDLTIEADVGPITIDINQNDSNPVLHLSNSDNGFDIYSMDNSPEGSVFGTNGDIAVEGNGLADSSIYLNKSTTSSDLWGKVDLLQKYFQLVTATSTLSREVNRIIAEPVGDISLTIPSEASNAEALGFEQEVTKNITNTAIITIPTPGFYGFSGNFVISKRGDTFRYLQDATTSIITYTNRKVVGILERTGGAENSIAGATGAQITLAGFNSNTETYDGLCEPDQATDSIVFPDVENLASGDLYEVDAIIVYRHSNNSVVTWHAEVDDKGISTNYSLVAETQSTSTSNEKTVNLKGLIRTGTNDTAPGLDTSVQLYFTLSTGNNLWFKRGWWKLTKIEGE